MRPKLQEQKLPQRQLGPEDRSQGLQGGWEWGLSHLYQGRGRAVTSLPMALAYILVSVSWALVGTVPPSVASPHT